MVMEVVPTPQCVGREFVRQYYTLLNKAPTHVHRFYNNNSSFVHGGLSEFNRGEVEPAVGQKQIHNCIQRLDFRDCHAKITQVDSQATLGNGVVVQVTGELSNGGQPMRRFTQTFVLCAQSPKQYYVHNDIFRYQDLVFGDDEADQEQNPFDHEEEEPDLPQPQDIPPPAQIEPAQYYPSAPPMPTMNGGGPPEDAPSPTPPAPLPAAQPPAHSPTPPAPLVQPQPPPAQPLPQPPSNPYISVEPQQQEQRPAAQESDWGHEAETEEEPPVEEEKPADEWNDEPEIIQPTPQQPPPPTEPVPSSNEPKTYASTLVKSSGGGVSNYNTSSNVPKSPPSPPPTYTRLESRNNETNAQQMRGGGVGGRGGGPSVRGVGGRGDGRSPSSRPQPPPPSNDDYAPRNDYGSRDQPTRDQRDSDQMSVEGGGGMGGERRRYPSYSDDHQLFLGNLPLHASEADLRDLFRQFGNIVDLRIMSKSNLKSQNGNKVPNYGFIIFESVEHVQNTLQARPIFFPVPGEPDVKLNVEEKKSRPRMDMGGGRGGPPRPGQMGPPPPRGGLGRGGQRGGFTRGARPAGFSQRGGPR